MYLHESTLEQIEDERRRLSVWQARQLQRDGTALTDGVDFDKSKVHRLLRQVGVPSQAAHMRLADYTEGPLAAAAAVFEETFPDGERTLINGQHGLALLGALGTGKTTFAGAALRRAAWRGLTIKHIDIEDLSKFFTTWIELSANGDRYDDYAERADGWRAELWRVHCVYDVLVVDDLGRSKVPDFVYDELTSLLRKRVGNECYTIVTANMTKTELKELVGQQLSEFIFREFKAIPFSASDKVDNRAGR